MGSAGAKDYVNGLLPMKAEVLLLEGVLLILEDIAIIPYPGLKLFFETISNG